MVSPAVNVLRYTALAAGILYGIQHQRTLYKKQQQHKDSEEYAHKEALIRKAKEEYKKKTSPPSGVITDPEDSRFDLEKFLQYVAELKH
ncbi:ATP synthase E chain-domain-containing protein [Terfezia claveryi]|nr:ATP synthase E chain-domain-containing protein [Terfezia claveryi]